MPGEALAVIDWSAAPFEDEASCVHKVADKELIRRPDTATSELCSEIIAFIPNLRAFAISLAGRSDEADDIVQETIVKALANLKRFRLGTNLQAWLFTILRNNFHTNYRKRRREAQDIDGVAAARLVSIPEQGGHLELQDMRAALAQLPALQREALLLIGAEGLSYEETASICNVPVGTVKSRVSRARMRMAELLGYGDPSEIGPDVQTRAAVSAHLT
jgi:RNA polymerase sigma-70 factor (ECF subfamily)